MSERINNHSLGFFLLSSYQRPEISLKANKSGSFCIVVSTIHLLKCSYLGKGIAIKPLLASCLHSSIWLVEPWKGSYKGEGHFESRGGREMLQFKEVMFCVMLCISLCCHVCQSKNFWLCFGIDVCNIQMGFLHH